ncbi:putative membrane protein [Glaesserella parasuis 174]|nr:putative membrane protein [Glaesserella parasuis 174]
MKNKDFEKTALNIFFKMWLLSFSLGVVGIVAMLFIWNYR